MANETTQGKEAPEIKFRREANADPKEISRRKVLGFIGWTTFWTTIAASLAGTGRFMVPEVIYEPSPIFKAGLPKDYPVGVSTRYLTSQRVWIINDSGIIYALVAICTHLGCTPDWLNNENKFKCNCHGSGYYISGVNFEGPTPRAMERAKIAIGDDGQIVIDKSKKFIYEKGDWESPEAFIKAV
jgi:cytochrome b6-f complex iron-sulfur subunit